MAKDSSKYQVKAQLKYRVFITDGKNESGYQDVYADSAEEAEKLVMADLEKAKKK